MNVPGGTDVEGVNKHGEHLGGQELWQRGPQVDALDPGDLLRGKGMPRQGSAAITSHAMGLC